ncbi:hypothetical protein ACOME3_009657 [Neoechinorhynchus agilis]
MLPFSIQNTASVLLSNGSGNNGYTSSGGGGAGTRFPSITSRVSNSSSSGDSDSANDAEGVWSADIEACFQANGI